MKINKCCDADTLSNSPDSHDDLALIHQFSKRPLRDEEVYRFSVKLCDNEIDRDGERFTYESLRTLADMFVGKTGLFDHQWSAEGQLARIYRTELCDGEGCTGAGDAYCYIKAYAYMLRNEKNQAWIDEIEAGIKKEVSVGCSVAKTVCSVCGKDYNNCEHQKGLVYQGKRCFAELCDPVDAYEWSFVAVPAQPSAGVMKHFAAGSLRDCVKQFGSPALFRELETLEKQAQFAKTHIAQLRRDVVRAMLCADDSFDGETAEAIAAKLDVSELAELHRSFAAKAHAKLCPQLPLASPPQSIDRSDFRV